MMAIGFLWTGHDYERAGVWFRRALALAWELDDVALRAHSLNRLGNWLQNTGRIQEALEAHQEALRLFESQADRQGMAQTLEMLGMAHYYTGDPARTVKDFAGRAIELFRALGDRQSLFSVLAARAIDSAPETIETTFSALRTHDECVQDAEEALRLARQTNSQSGQAFVEMATTLVLSSFGEFGPALAHAQEALRSAATRYAMNTASLENPLRSVASSPAHVPMSVSLLLLCPEGNIRVGNLAQSLATITLKGLQIARRKRAIQAMCFVRPAGYTPGSGSPRVREPGERRRGHKMSTSQKKSFNTPDETRTPPHTKMEFVNFGDISLVRAIWEPGWRWSEHIRPIAGTQSCQGTHFTYVISGRFRTRMDDGTEFDLGPGDIAITAPGHDAWVLGDEPCVVLDFQDASRNV
ncbi:MAG: hypothetical protein NVS3B14_10420 [Ktedonobacteraceae bacterium]